MPEFRLPYSLFDKLKAAADKSGRSVNAKVVARLTDSFADGRLIGGMVERLAARLARPENKSELEALLEIIYRLTEEGSSRDKSPMVDPEDAVTRPLPHPTKMRFVWHSRFYTAVLDRDLFEQWSVTRSWGSMKSGQGSGRVSVVENFEAGLALLQAIRRRRKRHGYRIVN